jgi:hypothetical protein
MTEFEQNRSALPDQKDRPGLEFLQYGFCWLGLLLRPGSQMENSPVQHFIPTPAKQAAHIAERRGCHPHPQSSVDGNPFFF